MRAPVEGCGDTGPGAGWRSVRWREDRTIGHVWLHKMQPFATDSADSHPASTQPAAGVLVLGTNTLSGSRASSFLRLSRSLSGCFRTPSARRRCCILGVRMSAS